jgi:hypothetical protein
MLPRAGGGRRSLTEFAEMGDRSRRHAPQGAEVQPREGRNILLATFCGLLAVLLLTALFGLIMLWTGRFPHPS